MKTTPESQLSRIVEELAELARSEGWNQIADGAAALLSKDSPTWLLVASDAALLASTTGDLVREAARDGVRGLRLEDLASDALTALPHDRVVALFRCGSLLSADAMDALSATVTDRPPGTFALVFVDGGQLTDTSDLKQFERSTRRWAVAGGGRGPLADHGIFLVGDTSSAEFLKGRLKDDRRKLETWLQAPGGFEISLRRWQALQLLEHAETLRERASVEPQLRRKGLGRDAVAQAKAEIARGRALLARRIDSDLSVLDRSLGNALDRVVRQTARELRPILAREAPTLLSETDLPRLRQLVQERLASAGTAWQREARQELETTEREMRRDLEGVFSVVDWKLVNRTLGAEANSYPAKLFGPLEGQIVEGLSPSLRTDLAASWSWQPESGDRKRVLVVSAVTAALSAMLLLALRTPLPWIPWTSVSAALGTGWLGGRGIHDRATRSATSDIEKALQRDVDAARRELGRAVAAVRPQVLAPLEDRVRALEVALGTSPEEEKDAPSAQAGEGTSVLLQELRRRILEANAD